MSHEQTGEGCRDGDRARGTCPSLFSGSSCLEKTQSGAGGTWGESHSWVPVLPWPAGCLLTGRKARRLLLHIQLWAGPLVSCYALIKLARGDIEQHHQWTLQLLFFKMPDSFTLIPGFGIIFKYPLISWYGFFFSRLNNKMSSIQRVGRKSMTLYHRGLLACSYNNNNGTSNTR